MPSATAAGSASSKTITGALPPSSRCTRLSVSAAVRAMILPVSTSPVSDTSRTSGCLTIASPAGTPSPVMTFSTPARQDVRRELREAQSRQRRLLGRLQHLHVARGQRRRELPDRHHQRVVPRRDAADDPDRLTPQPRGVAAHVLAGRLAFEQARGAGEEADVVGATGISSLAYESGLPTFRDSSSAISSPCSSSASASLSSISARSPGVVSSHSGRAFFAACDGPVDVLGARARHLGDRLAGRRVQHLHGLAARQRRPTRRR